MTCTNKLLYAEFIQDHRTRHRIYGVRTLLLFALRDPFSRIFADPRSADLFYILLFGLSFTALYTVIRGSFWGNRRFFAYSVVELFEEISMITIGIVLILVVPSSLPNVNKAAVAVFVSHFLSFIVALVYYFIKGGKFISPKKEFAPMLKSSLPVTSMRATSSLITSLISVIFPMRLIASGVSSARAMSEYGVVFGMVMPVLMLPSTLIGSIALVLVPELAESYYKKEKDKVASLVKKSLNITLLTPPPCSFRYGFCRNIWGAARSFWAWRSIIFSSPYAP